MFAEHVRGSLIWNRHFRFLCRYVSVRVHGPMALAMLAGPCDHDFANSFIFSRVLVFVYFFVGGLLTIRRLVGMLTCRARAAFGVECYMVQGIKAHVQVMCAPLSYGHQPRLH